MNKKGKVIIDSSIEPVAYLNEIISFTAKVKHLENGLAAIKKVASDTPLHLQYQIRDGNPFMSDLLARLSAIASIADELQRSCTLSKPKPKKNGKK